MHYLEFKNAVSSYMADHVAPDCQVEIRELVKNNHTLYDGLVVVNPRCNVSPTIYLQPYYHRMLNGVSLSDVLEDIWQTYCSHMPDSNVDTDLFTDYEKVKDHVVIKLINYERNREFLEQVPHRRYLDLAVVFQILVRDLIPHAGSGTITLTHSYISAWGIDSDRLLKDAVFNSPRLLPPWISEICEMLQQLVPAELQEEKLSSTLPEGLSADPGMYVLTNNAKTNGASTILYPGLLRSIAEKFDSDLYLLPSSIHEFILIPCGSEDHLEMLEDLSSMVESVNETELEDEEILSEQAYYYSRKEDLIHEFRQMSA